MGQGSPCPQSPSPSPVDDHERNWVASQDESNFSDFTGGSPEVDTSAEIDLGAEAPVILITTVDIGEGRSGQIEVRAGENTTQVAKRFCLEHGLPEQVVVPLSKHLLDNLSNLAGIQQHGDDRRAKKGKPKPQKVRPAYSQKLSNGQREREGQLVPCMCFQGGYSGDDIILSRNCMGASREGKEHGTERIRDLEASLTQMSERTQ